MSLLLGFITSKYGRWFLIIVGNVIAILAWDYNERQLGAQKLQNAINQQNERALTNANQAETLVRDCYSSHGRWVYDGSSGKCKH